MIETEVSKLTATLQSDKHEMLFYWNSTGRACDVDVERTFLTKITDSDSGDVAMGDGYVYLDDYVDLSAHFNR